MFSMSLRPFRRFPCVLVRALNQKRFFSVFKVSLNMMRQSDSASADVEIRKPPKELHLSGAPDCPIEQPSVWSFFLRSIVHSSFIILILLFDRILGLLFALQAECPRSTSSIPTSVRAIKVADGLRFVWLHAVRLTTSLHLSPMSCFVFLSLMTCFADLSHSAGGLVAWAALRIEHQPPQAFIQRSIVHSSLIILIARFD